jgi:hypothetical protein
MPATVISGRQVKDSSIQRVDLDTSTVGQAVVAKLVQGANITLSSTGADSGTGDVTISATGTGATVAVGTTTTLPPGSAATVTNSGSSSAAVFNFGIPAGAQWWNGSGAPGTISGSQTGDYYLDTASGDVYVL